MRLWLYSIKCVRIVDWKLKDKIEPPCSDDALKHNILLFCLDEKRRTHIVRISDYYTFITILLQKAASDRYQQRKFDYQILADDVNDGMNAMIAEENQAQGKKWVPRPKRFIQDAEAKQVRLLIGYTGSAPHVRLRLRLTQESHRFQVMKYLSKRYPNEKGDGTEMRVGDIPIEQFVHKHITPETEFLLERKLDLCSWFEISNYSVDSNMAPYYSKNVVPLVVSQNFVGPLATLEEEPCAPQLSTLYLRVEANSFTATSKNQNNPSFDIPEDNVQCVSLCTSSKDQPLTTFALTTINGKQFDYHADDDKENNNVIRFFETERKLLRALADSIAKLDAHIIVFASDEKCGPTSLFYLTKRAARYNMNLGFSKLLHAPHRYERRACGKTGEMIVMDHYGMERVDVCQILPRAQISPNLDGFTLVDAARHEKLLDKRDKEFFQQIIHLDYVGTTTLSTARAVIADNKLMTLLLRAIESGNNFTLGVQEIARMCMLDITSVVERGQQARVGGLFYKWYHKKDIVINDEQTKKPYVVVNKPRQESSYPRPPWLQNPPIESMRGTQRPGQVIREPLPKHVEFLMDMEHANTFELPQQQQKAEDVPIAMEDNKREPSNDICSNQDNQMINELCDMLAADLLNHAQQKTEQKVPVENDEEREDDEKNQRWWTNKHGDAFERKSRKKVKTKAEQDAAIAYRGGCVMDAILNFYRLPEETILTVDFASLYPSIMRAFRICYMRVVYDPSWLERSDVELEYVPITETQCVVFAKRHLRDGEWQLVDDVTPEIVADVMQLRDRVRKQQKGMDPTSFAFKVLDSRQLAAKTIANSTYGFTGSKTSTTPCTALAAAITQIGQWKINTVRFIFIFFGNMVVYGDTDSNMIMFWVPKHLTTKDEIMNWIYDESMRLVKVNMKVCIAPNKLEPETLKTPYLLLGKKTYAAAHYNVERGSWNEILPQGKSRNVLKGIAAKKRDKCGFAQRIGCELAYRFLDDPMVSFETLAEWFQGELVKIPMGTITSIEQLNPFIITCALNGEYKKEDVKSVKALHLAQMTEENSGTRPRVGTRIPYVVTYKPKEKLQAQWCEIPSVFLKTKSILNVAYILNNHVFNVVKQILSLPIHAPLLQMFETCIQKHICKWTNIQNKSREITHFFQPTTSLKKTKTT